MKSEKKHFDKLYQEINRCFNVYFFENDDKTRSICESELQSVCKEIIRLDYVVRKDYLDSFDKEINKAELEGDVGNRDLIRATRDYFCIHCFGPVHFILGQA